MEIRITDISGLSKEEMLSACLVALEECGLTGEGVAPWQTDNVLLCRTLGSVWDFTLDDALFGGPEALTDYESMLREKGVIYTVPSPYTGDVVENNSLAPDSVIHAESARGSGSYFGRPFAQIRSKKPATCHSWNLRWIVLPLPYSLGTAFHWHPVHKT